MQPSARDKLRRFYQEAMLCPELLCLSCQRSAWNSSRPPCSQSRREDCALFVEDMAGRLAAEPPKAPGRRPAQHPR
ncbi:hypothetical protein Deba_2706 [Desulfarculus baarsii DSM 2075]|uniref:Uncharacterized protein n=1 Tax=Desulfarculus baarsii (strain ATCC 33931 / DSM 2075 / LMG 7858 / VKM B-1802 / 2st14) TaxID=644282 RepID=E1QKG7_DESB2|nr:hypothetical protein Deba_2706 [Desulfarculus baarsii DSM 2075]